MIERFSFPKGREPFVSSSDIGLTLEPHRIIHSPAVRAARRVVLPGEYDITPQAFRDAGHPDHRLVVDSEGNGLVFGADIYYGVHLPRDRTTLPICSPTILRGIARVHEIILYQPNQ
ncbi:MAG: hypothetical protein AAB553_01245 [Patescibacteria group bacterium]